MKPYKIEKKIDDEHDHTCNNKRSDNGNERNIRQRSLKVVSTQMLFESITPHAREARYENTRHHHVSHRHQKRQRRYQQRRHHRHHEEHRPHNTAGFVQYQPRPRHQNSILKK